MATRKYFFQDRLQRVLLLDGPGRSTSSARPDCHGSTTHKAPGLFGGLVRYYLTVLVYVNYRPNRLPLSGCRPGKYRRLLGCTERNGPCKPRRCSGGVCCHFSRRTRLCSGDRLLNQLYLERIFSCSLGGSRRNSSDRFRMASLSPGGRASHFLERSRAAPRSSGVI